MPSTGGGLRPGVKWEPEWDPNDTKDKKKKRLKPGAHSSFPFQSKEGEENIHCTGRE